MDELVQRLCESAQPVTASRVGSSAELQERIELGYVLVEFPQTQGGTELGFPLDRADSDLAGADFTAGTGTVRLTGQLRLNYVDIHCRAEIDLATLRGTARLEPVDPPAGEPHEAGAVGSD